MSSRKATLRLAEQIDKRGRLTSAGAERLIFAVAEAAAEAAQSGCAELLGFATSAVRDAGNSSEVITRVAAETGVTLHVLSGTDESRLTFLAVRRWCGWGAGRILGMDIGGGSLELAVGVDEEPDVALSLPLGAGRVFREQLNFDAPSRGQVAQLRSFLAEELTAPARILGKSGAPDRVVATSKTFRSLARLSGAAPSSAGPRVRRVLTLDGLRQIINFISRMTGPDRAELDGVSADRAPQLVAGALVAEAAMRALGVDTVEICPWALREGVILRRLDREPGQDWEVDRK